MRYTNTLPVDLTMLANGIVPVQMQDRVYQGQGCSQSEMFPPIVSKNALHPHSPQASSSVQRPHSRVRFKPLLFKTAGAFSKGPSTATAHNTYKCPLPWAVQAMKQHAHVRKILPKIRCSFQLQLLPRISSQSVKKGWGKQLIQISCAVLFAWCYAKPSLETSALGISTLANSNPIDAASSARSPETSGRKSFDQTS